jgi:hypothetical protein
MKRKFSIVMIIVLLLLTIGSKPEKVFAASLFGVSWESSFQVLSLGEQASISISFYNADGTMATMAPGYSNPQDDTVLAGLSNTYYPLNVASGFSGSVVIASSAPVAVVSNLVVKTTAQGLGSYVAFNAGAPKIYFPLLMKGNSSQTTFFSVQNAGLSDAEITIKFTPTAGGGYATISDIVKVIQPGAAQTFDLSTLSQFSSAAKWVGSATVSVTDTANDVIVGVATTVNQKYSTAYQLSTYNAFTKGSPTVVLPLIQENNSGNRTSINCQNVSNPAVTATINVEYTGSGTMTKASESRPDIVSNGLAVFLQDYAGTTKFVGAAKVTSTPQVDLVCVVQQQKPSRGYYSAYEGFDPTTATNKVVLPEIQSRNGSAAKGYVYTSINLATADGLAHNIKCVYNPAPGISTPPDSTATGVAAVNFVQKDVFGTGAKYIGGATCTVTDDTSVGLFAIVNKTRDAAPEVIRDVLSSYDGFNQ